MQEIRIAIHQPNFCPWLPFYYKMAMVDIFVLLSNVQFEKNGFQNRFNYRGKWITKPVNKKTELISEKKYTDGQSVLDLNQSIIRSTAGMLGIDTKIYTDVYLDINTVTATGRLIEIIDHYSKGKKPIYVTNPSAKDKYLQEDMMRAFGIGIEYCKVPRHLQISTWEAIEKYGINGVMNQFHKPEKNEKSIAVL